jgi:small subunit ribosomal protein S5
MTFAVLAVVGNKKGKVGIGLGKAGDVTSSVKKAVSIAKKHLVEVPLVKGTIPFAIRIKDGAAKILLMPAPQGSGVIAGGAVRSVVSAAGIVNISSKVLGTSNKLSNVYATIKALKEISRLHKKMELMKGKQS